MDESKRGHKCSGLGKRDCKDSGLGVGKTKRKNDKEYRRDMESGRRVTLRVESLVIRKGKREGTRK